MGESRLEAMFLCELADGFRATAARIQRRMAMVAPSEGKLIIEDELRGLFHGLLVMFDGGTALANEGLISIVDEDGVAFRRNLHEICFDVWQKDVP